MKQALENLNLDGFDSAIIWGRDLISFKMSMKSNQVRNRYEAKRKGLSVILDYSGRKMTSETTYKNDGLYHA